MAIGAESEVEMRHLVVVASLLLVSGAAVAQAQEAPTIAQAVQAPVDTAAGMMGDYYVLAIAAGAVVGAVVASSVTGGIAAPIVGGVVGGYVGAWVYRK
jgi:predicted MFS family arabinose efflux permease